MALFKKLLFGLLYLVTFFLVLTQAKSLLKSTDIVFDFSQGTLIALGVFIGLILLSSLFFVIFITLSQDFKTIALILIISNLACFILFNNPENIILSLGFVSVGGLTYVLLDNKLKTYLTFQSTVLLTSPTLNFARLFILLFSLLFFFTLTTSLASKPFEIPDKVLDLALKLTPQSLDLNSSQNPNLTKGQKLSPELLKQAGIDQTALNNANLSQLTELPKETLKKALQAQLAQIIEPYQSIMPLILAFLLFVSLTSLASLIGILISTLLC